VLKHLHTDNHVIATKIFRAIKLVRSNELQPRPIAKSRPTIVNKGLINLCPSSKNSRGPLRSQQPEERSISAPVIKNSTPGQLLNQPQANLKPTSMRPGDQPVSAIKLLPRIVARTHTVIDVHYLTPLRSNISGPTQLALVTDFLFVPS
jgi:hypothetical protein